MRELSHEKRKLSKRWIIHRLRSFGIRRNLSPFLFSVCNIFSEKKFENSADEWLDEEQLCKERKWEVIAH